ncbi:unnamed protein product [Periconia digitata]|uniref:Uncharacterized protein n=1 Tax=Periconia digitata TaxID=1303443 RepID=A0A9W4U5R9_9PLEO|nr:unnamed protein product [Periconia digitata]
MVTMAVPQLMPMSMSPQTRPKEVGHAALQWVRGRRGRVFVLSMLLALVILIVGGASNSKTIATSYQALSSNHQFPSWHSHTGHLPAYFTSPLNPSNASLDLENNSVYHVPSHLNKATPNFHLVMPALEDGIDFCKTSLSAMILNYPPPTIVGLNERFGSEAQKEKAQLKEIHRYLTNDKLVNDEDMMLIVDGKDTWFQLPSDVLIKQYQNLLEDANRRLDRLYGNRYKQTIVFGAKKICRDDEIACHHVPEPMLPFDVYGKKTGKDKSTMLAKHIDSTMLMGPVKDIRRLYGEAVRIIEERKSQFMTVHSVMATIFAKQQMARNMHRGQFKITQATNNLFNWLHPSFSNSITALKEHEQGLTLEEGHEYEMMIGLDYAHALFQPFEYSAHEELLSLRHDGSTDLSKLHHPGTSTPPLTVPIALHNTLLPYWTPDHTRNNPSPNEKPVYIDHLEFQQNIDNLPDRETPWTSTALVQNTYTGTIPAAFHIDDRESFSLPGLAAISDNTPPHAPNISWTSFWYSGHERALLRNYFRLSQSSVGYHNVAVGGDRLWDQRGGRGGVWTAKEGLWLPWGEVDGVCGSVDLLDKIFTDGKGVWLHEADGEKGVEDRRKAEKEYLEALEKKKMNEEEKAKEEILKAKEEAEADGAGESSEGEKNEETTEGDGGLGTESERQQDGGEQNGGDDTGNEKYEADRGGEEDDQLDRESSEQGDNEKTGEEVDSEEDHHDNNE